MRFARSATLIASVMEERAGDMLKRAEVCESPAMEREPLSRRTAAAYARMAALLAVVQTAVFVIVYLWVT